MSELDPFRNYRNVEVQGVIGKIIFKSIPMSPEEAQFFWGQNIPIPLDVVPTEFWHDLDQEFPRFSEEMIEDF